MPSFGSQTDITFVDGSHKLIALLNCLDRHLSDDIREESLKACRHIVQGKGNTVDITFSI